MSENKYATPTPNISSRYFVPMHSWPVTGFFIPPYEDIEPKYKDESNPWSKLSDFWFFKGAGGFVFTEKEGIDPLDAKKQIFAVLNCRIIKSEHKHAGVAYLCDLWFEKVENWKVEDGKRTELLETWETPEEE